MKKLLTLSLLLLVAHSFSLKGQEFDLQEFDGPQPLSHFEICNDLFLNDESDLLDFASIFPQEPQEVTYKEQERKDKQETRIYTSQAEKNFIRRLEREHNLYKDMTPKQIADQRTQSAIDSRNAEERYNSLNKLMNPQIGHGVQKSKTIHSNNASCHNCKRTFLRSDLSLHKANCFPLHCEIHSSCHHLQFYSKWTLKDHLNKIHGLSNELIKAVYQLN